MAEEVLTDWLSGADSRDNFTFHSRAKWISSFQRRLLTNRKVERLLIRHFRRESDALGGSFEFLTFPEQPLIRDGEFRLITASLEYPERPPFDKFPDRNVTGTGDGASPEDARFISLVELLERTSFLIGKYAEGFRHGLRHEAGWPAVERPITPPSSTGMAFHRSPDAAVARGILECLERDSYLCHWIGGIRPQAVELTGNLHYRQAAEWCARRGLAFQVFNLRPFVPEAVTILAVIYDPECRDDLTLFCTGVACDVGPGEAFERALFELSRFLGLGLGLRKGLRDGTRRWNDPGLTHPMGRFYRYLRPENLPALDVFLPRTGTPVGLDARPLTKRESARRWRALMDRLLRTTGSEVFVYPAPVPSSLKDVLFGALVDIPRLQSLDYEPQVQVNERRFAEFSGSGATTPNRTPHPLP